MTSKPAWRSYEKSEGTPVRHGAAALTYARPLRATGTAATEVAEVAAAAIVTHHADHDADAVQKVRAWLDAGSAGGDASD